MPSVLAKNTVLLTAASIAQKAIAFLYFALIARTIGIPATGAYFLALALTTTMGTFDDIGLTSVVIREVAKTPERAKELVRNAIGAKLVVMPVAVLLAFVLPPLLHFSAQAIALTQIAAIVMLLDTISLTYYGVLRGMHVLKYESLGIFVGQSVTTIFGAIVLLMHVHDLRLLIVALVIGSGWNACFAVYQVVRRLGFDAVKPSYSMGFSMLKMASMFFLAAIFVKIYSYVDSFTLNLVIGPAAVGIYAVAYKLTYAFQFLPLAFVGALYPAMSAEAHDPVALKKTFLKAEWYVALLAAPIVFGLFSIAPELIQIVYGTAYAPAIPTLEILVFVLLFIYMDFPMGSLLNSTNNQHIKTAIMGVTMVINIISNLILIPLLGIPGAAFSALLCFSFMFFAGFFAAQRVIKVSIVELLRSVGGLLVSGGAMAVVLFIYRFIVPVAKPTTMGFALWLIPAVPIGALVFIGVAYAVKAIDKTHVKAFRALISRKAYVESEPADA